MDPAGVVAPSEKQQHSRHPPSHRATSKHIGVYDLHNQLHEKDVEISRLHERVASLSQQLQRSLSSGNYNIGAGGGEENGGSGKRRHHPISPHVVNVEEIRSDSTSKLTIAAQKTRLGRNASIATRRVLDNLSTSRRSSASVTDQAVVDRIMDMFQRPEQHMDYLNSHNFAKDLLRLASRLRYWMEREPRVVFLQSPAYVFGDIHGNLEDLHFFSDNIWRLGMSLTAGNFLFLGDYVDRGLNCLETVSYLFAMKHQLPHKVFLLRGNHETRDVNGWEEHYGERSFLWQCRNRFGDDLGYRLWEACNQVFDRLPLAAVIDQDIFCVHGGIPRPIHPDLGNPTTSTTRIQDILTVPKVAGINPPYEHEDDLYQQVASDCIWSDPASEEQEMTTVDPDTGFGQSLRGGGAICFGNKAVTDFLTEQDYSYIMRAHEAHAEGVAVSKEARVFTVFSTSKDHNQGSQAMAGCILVDNDKLQVINRSPAYKNQYIHRRDSVSLAALTEQEILQRMKLGLVRTDPNDIDQYEDEEEMEEWEDFDITEEDVGKRNPTDNSTSGGDSKGEEYKFDRNRRSSIDLSTISQNIHDDLSSVASEFWETDTTTSASSVGDFEPNKRHRSKEPNVQPIHEHKGEEADGESTDSVLNEQDKMV